jgi:GT2 family glycosyltransferase
MLMDRDPELLDGVGDAYHVSGRYWRIGHGMRGRSRYLEPMDIFAPCAAAALYRRDVFEEVGGFDEDFFCYVEDVDLGFRLRLRGYNAQYVPDAVVRHTGSAITGVRSEFAIYHGHRNMVWAYVKNFPGWRFWLYLPLHVAANVASVVLYGRIALKSKIDAVSGIRRFWRKRREIQRNRQASYDAFAPLLARDLSSFLRRTSSLDGARDRPV